MTVENDGIALSGSLYIHRLVVRCDIFSEIPYQN